MRHVRDVGFVLGAQLVVFLLAVVEGVLQVGLDRLVVVLKMGDEILEMLRMVMAEALEFAVDLRTRMNNIE